MAAAGGAGPTLTVEHMDVIYRVRGQDRRALRDVSFQIGRSESYGLVGESGSGKSTVALALTRYLPRNGRVSAGSINISGLDPLSMGRASLRDLRARTVSMVYQEPGRALNPSIRVGRQVAEVYEIAGLDRAAALERAEGMLRKVQISDPRRRWPPSPPCSFSTSRRPRWTRPSRPRCSTWWRRCARSSTPRCCSSATTWP
jgi:peptide/nickel transport system ATP-binding protein